MALLLDDFMSQADRDQGSHERDPFAGYIP